LEPPQAFDGDDLSAADAHRGLSLQIRIDVAANAHRQPGRSFRDRGGGIEQ